MTKKMRIEKVKEYLKENDVDFPDDISEEDLFEIFNENSDCERCFIHDYCKENCTAIHCGDIVKKYIENGDNNIDEPGIHDAIVAVLQNIDRMSDDCDAK